jgi:hypothetical protein
MKVNQDLNNKKQEFLSARIEKLLLIPSKKTIRETSKLYF